MTRRVLNGQKGGEYGFWVSKPGVDVVSAADDDMLMSTTRSGLQVVASGIVSVPGPNTTVDVAVPDVGYFPLIVLAGSYACAYSFPATGIMRIHIYNANYTSAIPTVSWAMTNQKIWH